MDISRTKTARWVDAAKAQVDDLVTLRRAIHADPELGLQCPRTLAKIKGALAGLPLDYREGVSTTGLVAVLRGARAGRTVLLRGDMDALAMTEETGLPFASQVEGAMHACGHDVHTAILVGAARALSARQAELAGTVVFMFQPGEEGAHGARRMMDDGLLEQPRPEAAFALHIAPQIATGMFSGRPGPLLASADVVSAVVHGRGGHAAMPHNALDPVPVACEIVTALQTFVTRQVSVFDPAVLTIAKIAAGTTDNVIPRSAEILGTLRTLSDTTRAQMHEGFCRIVEHIAIAHGMTAEARIAPGYPPTINDPRALDLMRAVVVDLWSEQAWRTMPSPAMGSEDFSYVLREIPGAMIFLGVAQENSDLRTNASLHNTRLLVNEAALGYGVAMLSAVAERFLSQGFAG